MTQKIKYSKKLPAGSFLLTDTIQLLYNIAAQRRNYLFLLSGDLYLRQSEYICHLLLGHIPEITENYDTPRLLVQF